MKTLRDFRRVLDRCRFGNWSFYVDYEGHYWMQVWLTVPCAVTEINSRQSSRKWLLSAMMTDHEVVQTAFLAVKTAMEHEVRERFLYEGAPVFMPHYNLDRLAAGLLQEPEQFIKVRP